jgi:restriction endonuclease Mrr
MSVPDFQSFFKPLLAIAYDGKIHTMKEARETIAGQMNLSPGRFSDEALQYVETIDPKVILIDGKQLAYLLIDNNLGTSVSSVYEIKRIDSDYFSEE